MVKEIKIPEPEFPMSPHILDLRRKEAKRWPKAAKVWFVCVIIGALVGIVIAAWHGRRGGYVQGFEQGGTEGARAGFQVGLERGRACITDGVAGACEGNVHMGYTEGVGWYLIGDLQ